MTLTNQDLGRAGDSQRRYHPKRNANRIINRIVTGEKRAFPPSAMIVQQKKIPDASFWQGLIDWLVMASKTDAIILRAGQNTWADTMFLINYQAAKARNMLRGIYYFYDDRASPGAQAAKLIELIGDDPPELPIFADWERTYGGAFGGLKKVVAFMQAIEKEYPGCQVGLYTGYYWFTENSNAILNFFQYQYLKDKPLWLASYTDASAVRIPAPWTTLDFWQFGTPSVDWGQSSAELDMSYFNGTIEEFYNRYAGGTPPPVEMEITMQGTVKTFTNIRSEPNKGSVDLGDLLTGDIVEWVDEYAGLDGLTWLKLTSATRNGAPVLCTDGAGVAGRYAWKSNIELLVTPAPATEYTATFDGTFTLTDAAGKKYNAHVVLDVPLDPQ